MDRETIFRIAEFSPLIPLYGKRPAIGGWTETTLSIEQLRCFMNKGITSFGMRTEKTVVLDFDDIDESRVFFRKHRKIIKTIVRSKNGIHYWFKMSGRIGNRVRVNGTKMDVRGIGGLIVVPGSVVNGHLYHFIPGFDEVDPSKLSLIDLEWVPKRKPVTSLDAKGDMIARAHSYMKKVDPSVEGCGGDNWAFRVANVLVVKFGLTPREAYPLMLEWNERNVPPWNGNELNQLFRKLQEAERINNVAHRGVE